VKNKGDKLAGTAALYGHCIPLLQYKYCVIITLEMEIY